MCSRHNGPQELVAEEGDDAITEDMEELYYTERLDGGLFALQSTDYILAWLAIEDDGVSYFDRKKLVHVF